MAHSGPKLVSSLPGDILAGREERVQRRPGPVERVREQMPVGPVDLIDARPREAGQLEEGAACAASPGIFRDVAHAREGGWDTNLPYFHLGQAVSRADEEFLGQIEDASAPFWQHVREALRAQQASL